MFRLLHAASPCDPTLSKKIAAELPAILYKSLCAYLEFSDRVKDLWVEDGLPEYFVNQRDLIA